MSYADRTQDKTKAERWDANFKAVRKFYLDNGRWPVLRDESRSSTGAKLGDWCNTQRMSKKGKGASKITPQQIARLDEIGFDWAPLDERWDQKFEAAKEFHSLNGRWPKSTEGALGAWCQAQKQAKKKGRILPARIAKLDGIGFDWGPSLAAMPAQRWNENFEQVRRFREEHGRWPIQRRDGALGRWCNTQRQAKKGDNHHVISPAQIAKLDGIGFEWGTTRTPEQRWDANFAAVRRFREDHGRWPMQTENALGRWCDTQRQARKGKGHNRISPVQIAKLDGIGFDWGTTRTGTKEQRWNANFEALRLFRVEHGRWPTESALATWCSRQRQAKRGRVGRSISPERIAKLDGIGFDWGTPATPVAPTPDDDDDEVEIFED
jgi:hypothetical protein